MHYYKKNIGDYAKKAGRLTMLQHGAYTLLLDSCYDRERFPTLDEAIEWTWASTKEEIEAVTFVLKKFFLLEGDQYVQNRIREELANYHSNSETNKRIALEREAKRREKSTKRGATVNEPPPNHKPRTKNQEPIDVTPDGVSSDVWDAFVKQRKAKKAQINGLVMSGIIKEADKAGWTLEDALKEVVLRNWQSFKAEWVTANASPATRFAGDI